MNRSLLASIKWVVSQHGEYILGDPLRLKKILAKHTKNEPKAERIAFGRCIEIGCYKELKKAQNMNERSQVKSSLSQKLQSTTGINLSLCRDALDILDATIFGNIAPAPAAPSLIQSSSSIKNQISNQLILLWKKPIVKWSSFIVAIIFIITLIFNFAYKAASKEIVDSIIDERIEELKRITEHQEQITDQLDQIKKQIENDQNNQSPTGQNNTQQKTERNRLIENLQNDLLIEILAAKKEGRRNISGRIKVLIIPTNYKGNRFRMNFNNLTPIVQDGLNIIKEQARRYNQNITIEWEYDSYFTMNNSAKGLQQYSLYRNRYRNFNHVITVYAVDKTERSYITYAGSLGRSEEHAILWFKDARGFTAGTLAHEIFHAFGAEDLYYEQGIVPLEVERNFKTLLGNSIMLNSQGASGLDPINAWLIGWNKTPEPWYAWFIDKRKEQNETRFY
ncbi:MAG: hypothetical protein LBU88_01485 [Treponema sp.]|jgi:hypothetical protein|nr:hypothetical protein [Treponema sp.]